MEGHNRMIAVELRTRLGLEVRPYGKHSSEKKPLATPRKPSVTRALRTLPLSLMSIELKMKMGSHLNAGHLLSIFTLSVA